VKRILALSLIASVAIAEEEVNFNEVVVEASMSDLSLELQPRSISVIDKKEVSSHVGTGDIQGVLENAPGIEYSRAGGINGQISMRGMNSNEGRNIFTIDGVRMTGRSTLELNHIDPDSLEAVEVMRGPVSSLYGSAGMNGLVNFKSRKWNGDTTRAFNMDMKLRSIEYASANNMVGGRLEYLGGGDGWDVLLGVGGKIAENYRSSEGKIPNSKFKRVNADFNVGYNVDDFRYYLQGRFGRVETFRGGGQGAAPGASYGIYMSENPFYDKYIRAGVSGNHLDTALADAMDVYLYYRDYNTDIWNNRLKFNGNYIHQEVKNSKFYGGKAHFDKFIDSHAISYGVDFLHQRWDRIMAHNLVKGITAYPNRNWDHTDIGVYLKDDWSVSPEFILSAGIRYDYIFSHLSKIPGSSEASIPGAIDTLNNAGTISEDAVTGSLGATYFVTENLGVLANVSHNFKAPLPTAMMQMTPSGDATNMTIPNLDIKSEYSDTIEGGFRYNDEVNFFSLIGYYTKYKDMLKLNKSAPRQYQNIGKAYITGVELEGKHKFGDFGLKYSAAYTRGEDESTHTPLAYIAPFSAKVTLSYETDFATFSVSERVYSKKTRISPTDERETAGYAMTDIAADFNLGYFHHEAEDMHLIVGVDNLFDKKGINPTTYEDVGYGRSITNPLLEPGINAYVKFKYDY